MTAGPIEYVLLSYPEGGLGSHVIAELWRLVAAGTIRLLDLGLIKKDDTGGIELSRDNRGGGLAEFAAIYGEVSGLLNQEDAEYAGDLMAPGTSAVLLAWETPWARPLFAALRSAGMVLLEGGRTGPSGLELGIAEDREVLA